jgi:hypothetical protein
LIVAKLAVSPIVFLGTMLLWYNSYLLYWGLEINVKLLLKILWTFPPPVTESFLAKYFDYKFLEKSIFIFLLAPDSKKKLESGLF